MTCPCEHPKPMKGDCLPGTPAVIEIDGGEIPVLFHTVVITADQGDVDTIPPTTGKYRNTRVVYEANKTSYLYDSDGIPQELTGGGGAASGVVSVNGKTGVVKITLDDLGGANADDLAREREERLYSDELIYDAVYFLFEQMDNKQDKLIAGTNITIDPDGTINSAKYTAGDGLKLTDHTFSIDPDIIPKVNNAKLTIKKDGVVVGEFTANADEDIEIDLSDTGSLFLLKTTSEAPAMADVGQSEFYQLTDFTLYDDTTAPTEADIAVGKTLVYDELGKVGLVTRKSTGYTVLTITGGTGGGGDAVAKYDYTTNIAVGGVPVGTQIARTDLLADIIKQMLVTVYYPTFVAPSASLTYSVTTLQEVKSTITARAATVGYNAGAINLQGVKQNNRGGAATKYYISTSGADTDFSDDSTSSGSFNVAALTRSTKGNIVITGKVDYAQGPQPLDSNGNPYQSPLPAGSVTATKTIKFIQAFFYGKTAGTSISDFTGLTKDVSEKGQKKYKFTTNNEHMVIAYDASYGDLTSILDPNSFEVISGWTKSSLTVDGFNYYVWIADSATTDTDAEFTFKF